MDAHQARQDLDDARGADATRHVNGEALVGELVDDRQALQLLAIGAGVEIAVAEILHDQQLVKFVGIGNIMASVYQAGGTRSMVSQNGILGHQIRRVTEFQYPWSDSAILVMCSDGINTHFDLNPYAGLAARDPSLIAATLYRDFSRGRDDATAVVLKQSKVE